MVGVIQTKEALRLAQQQGLDLVEMSPDANPPVCRIMDFGKFRYEEGRKKKLARKHQHSRAVKEIKAGKVVRFRAGKALKESI